mgnify:CR=1 FL=1
MYVEQLAAWLLNKMVAQHLMRIHKYTSFLENTLSKTSKELEIANLTNFPYPESSASFSIFKLIMFFFE